jgi:hypothetical protein
MCARGGTIFCRFFFCWEWEVSSGNTTLVHTLLYFRFWAHPSGTSCRSGLWSLFGLNSFDCLPIKLCWAGKPISLRPRVKTGLNLNYKTNTNTTLIVGAVVFHYYSPWLALILKWWSFQLWFSESAKRSYWNRIDEKGLKALRNHGPFFFGVPPACQSLTVLKKQNVQF